MWIIFTILIGFVAGLLAKFLMPGRDPGGFLITSLLGIGGALLAGYLGRSFGWYLEGEPAGFFASVVGAMLILGIYRMLRGRKA